MQLSPKEIKKLLQKEDPIILELGAHKGVETKKFLKEFKNIIIYCFEPDPRCTEVFKKEINDPRCTLIESAISNKDGKTILNMSGGYHPGKLSRLYKIIKALKIEKFLIKQDYDWDYSSSIKKSISYSNKYPWLNFEKKLEVTIIKIDTWMKNYSFKFIDFIWSDIQGAEEEMIEGGTNTLKITKFLFTEYGEKDTYPEALTREETIKLMTKHNFELIPKYSSKGKRGDLLFKNKSC